MAKEGSPSKEGKFERGSRWYRNFNMAVGSAALIGAGVVASPVVAGGLAAYGAFNFAEAGIGEAVRRRRKKKRQKKVDKNEK